MEKSLTRKVSDMVQRELDKNGKIVLQEQYKIAEEEFPEIPIEKLKHRIRTVIDSLMRKKTIKRTAPSSYSKN